MLRLCLISLLTLTLLTTQVLSRGSSAPSDYLEDTNYTNNTNSEATKSLSRRRRSVLGSFPSGSTLSVDISMSIPIPALKETSSTLDLTIPINLKLPSPAAKRSSLRRVEDDHATVYQMAENLMTNFGLDGKACVLRAICELAESRGLKHDGLVGKTLETLLLLDYSMSSTDSLYEYIAARTYGEHHGNCDTAYPQCPYSAFQILDNIESLQNLV